MRPGRNQKVDDPAEEELETAWAWLCDQNLTMNDNGKELPPEWALSQVLGIIRMPVWGHSW